jgi:hypothetical protein
MKDCFKVNVLSINKGVPVAHKKSERHRQLTMNINGWEIISTYTRAEAVADGFQVPISPVITKEAGIIYPVFFTCSVYDKYVVAPKEMYHQNIEGRLWDILFMFRMEAQSKKSSDILFTLCCQLPDAGDWTANEKVCEGNSLLRDVTLRAVIGPLDLDDPNPAITIMLPDED